MRDLVLLMVIICFVIVLNKEDPKEKITTCFEGKEYYVYQDGANKVNIGKDGYSVECIK